MKPKYLKRNDTISLVAPSFGCTIYPYDERMKVSIDKLSKDYRIVVGENCKKSEGIVASNTAKKRADEFMKAYLSDASVIWSVGGGETMVEILPHIDFKKIKEAEAKWFVGYSDNTNLTYTLTTFNDLETIYGACFPSFYDQEADEVLRMLLGKKDFAGYQMYQSLSADSHDLSPIKLDTKKEIKAFNYTKEFNGRLIGGCLDCLITLCGTRFDKTKEYIERHKKEGIIFFLEACDLNVIAYRRALFQLKESGWFQYIKGFIIGRPLHINEDFFGQNYADTTIDMLKEFNVPILLDCDIGHLKPTIPLRCGAMATIKLDNDNILISYFD